MAERMTTLRRLERPTADARALLSDADGGKLPARQADTVLSILVLMGTSEHPFDRLLDWVESWYFAQRVDRQSVQVRVQTGATTRACALDSAPMLDHLDLRSAAAESDVVITHAGPGSINDAFSAGIRPIVVPRRPDLGEHVDEHQLRFAAFLARRGIVDTANDEASLHDLLDVCLADPRAQRSSVGSLGTSGGDAPAQKVGELIQELLNDGHRPRRRRNSKRFRRANGQRRVLLASSSGGHLSQLYRLMPWLSEHQRHWVTFDTADANSLLTGELVTAANYPTTRNIANLARNTVLAWRLLRAERPDVIISTGAGVAVPFFWLARWFGVATVYIEVFDRVDLSTMTGKLCEPVTDLFLLQWEEQEEQYRRGVVVGHLMA